MGGWQTHIDHPFPSFSIIWKYPPTLGHAIYIISFANANENHSCLRARSEAHSLDLLGDGSASQSRQRTNSGRQPGEMWRSSSTEPRRARDPLVSLSRQGRIRGPARAREGLEGLREMPLHGKRLRRMAFALDSFLLSPSKKGPKDVCGQGIGQQPFARP